MFQDSGGLPLGGTVLLAFIIYALVSGFVTGPLVGERMAAKANWPNMCQSHIRTVEERKRPPVAKMPDIGCNDIMGMFGRGGHDWCSAYGRNMQIPLGGVLKQFEQQQERVRQEIIDQVTTEATSRCSCAVSKTIGSQRVALGIHAGSLRLITPAPVQNYSATLKASLNTPLCAMKG